jgi:hypothetical protein
MKPVEELMALVRHTLMTGLAHNEAINALNELERMCAPSAAEPTDDDLIETVRDEITFYGDSATVMDRRDMLRVVRRVLADHGAACAPSACPEGWVMVPKIPTGAMLQAAEQRFNNAKTSLMGFNARELAYAALLSASPAAPVVAEPVAWQPIETAPKDGQTIILGFMENGEITQTAEMQWSHIQRNGFFPGQVGMWVCPGGNFTWNPEPAEFGPSHWMPLPAHPVAQGASQQKEQG